MKRKALYTTIFFSLFGLSAAAQKASVKATLEPKEIKIGQQAKLTIEANHDDRTSLIWPIFTETISTNIELVKQGNIDTGFSEDKKIVYYKQELFITSFDSGVFSIPSFPFMYFSGDDTLIIYTDSLLLASATLPIDTLQGFHDITNPLEVPFSIWEIVPYALLALIVITAVVGIYYWIKRSKNKKTEEKPAPVIIEPAHVIALRDLDALNGKRLWQKGQIKNYYIELTDIIRRYLHNRFAIDATEMTTDEILQALRLTDISSESMLAITRLLRLADLVKFAKVQPIENEHEEAFKQAITFVELTAIKATETT